MVEARTSTDASCGLLKLKADPRVISLSPEAHHRALEMTRTMAIEAEYWPTIDPSAAVGSREQILDGYRAVRDQLVQRIRARFGSVAARGV